MRDQYFRDITEQGIEEARHISFLVEIGNKAVHSECYRSARDALTSKLEIESAKQFPQPGLEKATRKKKKGGTTDATDSE